MEMNPYPGPRSVLVLDSCHIHHVPGVAEMCEERGVKLIYLPPYSPDLNPIEEFFSYMKAFIQRNGQEFRDIVESGDKLKPYYFLYNILDTIQPKNIWGWFSHSNYV